MANVSGLKIELIFIIILALVLALIYYQALYVRHIPYIYYSAPYVDYALATVKGNQVNIIIYIYNQSEVPFRPTGGWALIVDTGQRVNLTVTGPNALSAVVPLTPTYLFLGSLGIRGLIYGYSLGHESSIGFFVTTPIHVTISLTLAGVNYTCNGGITILVNYSSPIPLIINSLSNLQLVDNNLRQFVVLPIGNVTINEYAPAGSGVLPINIPEGYVEGRNLTCGLINGHVYTVSMLINVTYVYPNINVTRVDSLISVVKYG